MSRALTFGQVADDYQQWRPGYPDAAVDWLAPRAPARVADVGAGTGKLTSSLLARGLTVDAVEPDPLMLAVLARNNPQARPHQSVSTRIPVADGSLDAVLVADAWHWFDAEATVAELRRVLKPGGWLGLIWNFVTPVQPWEYELSGIDPDRADDNTPPEPEFGYFDEDELQTARFGWHWEVTPEHCAANLATNSAVIAMSPAEREARLDATRTLLQQVCATTGKSTVSIRHAATCYRWTPASR
jgi:SAM-dependent methyltransferase